MFLTLHSGSVASKSGDPELPRGTESNLLMVTQPGSGRTGIQTLVCSIPEPSCTAHGSWSSPRHFDICEPDFFFPVLKLRPVSFVLKKKSMTF